MACIDKENLLKDLITIYAPMQEQKDILVKCIKKVNEQPTADIKEVKHGKWEVFGLRNPLCSLCYKYNYEKSDFCPHCGAKMDGGNEE